MNTWIKFIFLGCFLFTLSSCVDQEFDTPPGRQVQTEDISNTTIRELKELHIPGQAELIPAGTIIKGRVISDDEQGNFFREITIQDETAGILVRIDRTPLFTEFERGRIVYIDCEGLAIGDFANLIQIGYPGSGGNIDRIPEIFVNQHVIAGELPETPVQPVLVTIPQLNDNFLSTLVTVDSVEFRQGDLGLSLAVPNGGGTTNRTVEDCDGAELVLRNSDFSDFAGFGIPMGRGPITGVYSKFNSTKQLTIRDTDDLMLDGPRCGSGGGGVGGDRIDISELKTLFNNGITTAPDGFIQGVVISDYINGNIQGRNLVLQDDSGGIIVRLSNDHTIALGTEIKVSTNSVSISEFNGGLQIETSEIGIENLGSGTLPTPRVTTISELMSNFEDWESTLVTVEMAELSGGSTFSDADMVTDATGSVATFVYNDATFSSDALPSGMVTVTGIVSEFNVQQIIIRSRDDVQGGNTGSGDVISLADIRAAFESGSTSAPNGFVEGVVISDYTTMSVTGRNLHLQDDSGGIVIRFTDEHSIPLGTQLKINVNGTELSEFNGLLQLNEVNQAQITEQSAGTLPTPMTVKISDIIGDLESLESTLVVIEDVTFSGSTFSGSIDVSDDTGSLTMFTRSQAEFAGSSVPSGEVTVTAIVTQFNDAQILIRSLDDIE